MMLYWIGIGQLSNSMNFEPEIETKYLEMVEILTLITSPSFYRYFWIYITLTAYIKFQNHSVENV